MLLSDEIIQNFSRLLAEARDCIPTAMTLASVDERGRPTQRTMLMKLIDKRGFIFFTNSKSRKGQHFTNTPYACACVYWHNHRQQIEVEGRISTINNDEADYHWSSRERDNQITAWASLQSEQLSSRDALVDRINKAKKIFHGIQIPRPIHWQGYRLEPDRVEFWKADWHRLHERIRYDYQNDSWKKTLLNP